MANNSTKNDMNNTSTPNNNTTKQSVTLNDHSVTVSLTSSFSDNEEIDHFVKTPPKRIRRCVSEHNFKAGHCHHSRTPKFKKQSTDNNSIMLDDDLSYAASYDTVAQRKQMDHGLSFDTTTDDISIGTSLEYESSIASTADFLFSENTSFSNSEMQETYSISVINIVSKTKLWLSPKILAKIVASACIIWFILFSFQSKKGNDIVVAHTPDSIECGSIGTDLKHRISSLKSRLEELEKIEEIVNDYHSDTCSKG